MSGVSCCAATAPTLDRAHLSELNYCSKSYRHEILDLKAFDLLYFCGIFDHRNAGAVAPQRIATRDCTGEGKSVRGGRFELV
jgi:hypothetical protein